MKILIIAIVVLSSTAHAFNWSRCQNSQPVQGGHGNLLEYSSSQGSNTSISSTQGISSWGDCSLLGKMENVRKTFIAQNLSQLQQEIAKGNGEYLEAYARTHNCSDEGQKSFAREMKKHYFEIEAADFEGVFRIMELPFKNLSSHCPLT